MRRAAARVLGYRLAVGVLFLMTGLLACIVVLGTALPGIPAERLTGLAVGLVMTVLLLACAEGVRRRRVVPARVAAWLAGSFGYAGVVGEERSILLTAVGLVLGVALVASGLLLRTSATSDSP